MKTKYCYGYVRVSTSGQEELSPDSQAKLLKDFAKKNDMIVLQIFYELVTLLDVSVDQFFFPDKSAEKDTQRRQLDTLLDSMSEKGIRVVTATAKEIAEVETEDRGMSRTEF